MSAGVSVIIPTFNRGHVLGTALESVLGQVHSDLEVIVIDDGSSDGTRELVASAFGADSRVRYRCQPNAGAAAARNAGLELAIGEYVAFLDSDDSWKPWHLGLQLAGLAHLPEAGLIWANMDAVDAAGRVTSSAHLTKLLSAYRYFSFDELFSRSSSLDELGIDIPPEYRDRRLYVGDVFSPMVMGNLVNASSVVMRRERLERIGRFDEQLVSGEDYEFFLRACRAGPVAFADIPGTRVRIGTTDRLSELAMGLPIARAYLQVLERTLAHDAERITLSPSMITDARASAHRWVGKTELQAGSHRAARTHLTKALRLRPRPRILALLIVTFLPRCAVVRVVHWLRRLKRSLGRGNLSAPKD